MIGETLDDLPDDQRGVELESIWSEPGVLKELDELLDVSFKVNIGQVRHHVGHHLGCKFNKQLEYSLLFFVHMERPYLIKIYDLFIMPF